MKKKVAILTLYYDNLNYGGVLQAYALQKCIEEIGYETYQISYVLNSGYGKLFAVKGFIYNFLEWAKIVCGDKQLKIWKAAQKQRRCNIQKFSDGIPHTEVVTASSINKLVNRFDIFVCGSDQIWNPIGWQDTLFLGFVPNSIPKIAYAASVARDELTEKEIRYIFSQIKDFKAVSVREKKTKDLLYNNNCPIPISVMPDPTLLLRNNIWNKIANIKIDLHEQYVLGYFLGNNIEHREQAIKLAEYKKMKFIYIPFLCKSCIDWDIENSRYGYEAPTVPEFLYLLKNSNMVVTDSFHGVVFSLLYHREFWYLKRFTSNDSNSMNSRIQTLLENVGLCDHIVDELPPYRIIMNTTIDWIKVDSQIEMLREEGYSFLTSSLKGI